MEETKRKRKFLIGAIVCFGLALILLVPAIMLASSVMAGVIAFGGCGVILLIVYFFEKRAKLIIGILLTALFAIFLICTFAADGVFVWLAVPCLIAGSSLLFDCFMKKIGSKLTLPVLSVFFSFSFMPLWLLGEIIHSPQISTMLFLTAVLFPIIGIILGIIALSIALSSKAENEKQRKVGVGLSISAIAFPVLVVFVLILLLSTGVLVISLM